MATVELRLVGLYATIQVAIPDEMFPNVTVQTVLDYAVKQDPNLTVMQSQTNGGSLVSVAYYWATPPNSLSGKTRNAGQYLITEDLTGPTVIGWQYYIERPDPVNPAYHTLISKTNLTEPPLRFKIPSKSEKVQAGDRIIYRCVAVGVKPR